MGKIPDDAPIPCEDELPASSFCHRLGGDLNCKCSDLVANNACGTIRDVAGFARLDVTELCMRTCGKCPAQRKPLFGGYECVGGGHDSHGHGDHSGHGDHGSHRRL